MVSHNLKVAVRNLMKYKIQTLLSIICIAVGITAFSLVQSFLDNVRLPSVYDQPFSDRAYDLTFKHINSGEKAEISMDMVRALKKDGGPQNSELVALPVTGLYGVHAEFVLPDSTVRNGTVTGEFVDPDYLAFAGYTSAITGKKIARLKKGEAIIGEDLSKKIFNGKSPIGSVQQMAGQVQPLAVRIVDVYRGLPSYDDRTKSDELLFCLADSIEDHQGLPLFASRMNIVLKDGSSEELLLHEVNARLLPLGVEATLAKTVRDEQIRNHYAYKSIVYLVGVMVLLAAMTGFLRTQIQMFRMRRSELALRIVNGAKKKDLFGLLVAEPVLVIILAVVVAIIFDALLQEHIQEYGRMLEASGIQIDRPWRYSILTGGALLAVAAMASWLSLQRICNSTGNLAKNMRRSRNHLFRNIMLGLQIAVCTLFVCCTLILIKTSHDIMTRYNVPEDDNLQSEYLLFTTNQIMDRNKVESILGEIKQSPDLRRLALYDRTNLDIKEIMDDPEFMEKLGNQSGCFFYTTDDRDLPSVLGMDVEWFAGTTDHDECLLVGENLYERFSDNGILSDNALTVEVWGEKEMLTLPIGGIIRKIPYAMDTDRIVAISRYFESISRSYVLIPRPGRGEAMKSRMLEIIAKHDPENFNNHIDNYRDMINWLVRTTKAVYASCFILGLVSLLICSMSIFSAIALDTKTRRKEVAIRKVNGAKSADIYRLFGRVYVALLAVASAIAVPACVMFADMVNVNGNSIIIHDEVSFVMPVIVGILSVVILILLIVGLQIHSMMQIDPAKIIAKE